MFPAASWNRETPTCSQSPLPTKTEEWGGSETQASTRSTCRAAQAPRRTRASTVEEIRRGGCVCVCVSVKRGSLTHRGERLQDVASVLDHDGSEHCAGKLDEDDGPRAGVEALHHAVRKHSLPICLEDRHCLQRNREERELYVAHEEGAPRLGEHELQVDARKPRKPGRAERSEATDERRAACARHVRLGVLALHEHDARRQQHEREPLAKRKGLFEDEDREERRRERLRLIQHLRRGRRQVGDRHEDQVVLHRVAEGGHHQFERLGPLDDDVVMQSARQLAHRTARLHAEHKCAEGELAKLDDEDDHRSQVERLCRVRVNFA
mmetsp:Transcript_2999/g.7709  ORF Transcript_2999/g.7709 Transcript_2999/m.7709 type:complete len:323 (-) Transcript_2999:284-1252(-)